MSLKVYDPEDPSFLVQLVTEMHAIKIRSRGEEIALAIALRDLGSLSARTALPHEKKKRK